MPKYFQKMYDIIDIFYIYIYIYIYSVSRGECARLRENVP